MKKAKTTIRAKKVATKQNSLASIAMQPVAFATAIASKLTTLFK